MLEQGPGELNIIQACYFSNQPLPERILNAPELFIGSEIWLQAFFDLDTERSHGMGLTRIPRTAIRNYAIELDLDERQSQDLHYYVKAMDNANLIYLDERNDKK